jgi:hypothetical protein
MLAECHILAVNAECHYAEYYYAEFILLSALHLKDSFFPYVITLFMSAICNCNELRCLACQQLYPNLTNLTRPILILPNPT